jgi:hypothetical protein
MNCPFVSEQIQGGFEGDNKRKMIKFAFIFMLLSKGKFMTTYETSRHWNDTSCQKIAKHVHPSLLKYVRKVISIA